MFCSTCPPSTTTKCSFCSHGGVPSINPPKPRASAPEIDVATQLKNMKLKKVVKEEKQEKKDNNMGGEGKNFLQNTLSTHIRNRRNNLHMHDEEEDDDWD